MPRCPKCGKEIETAGHRYCRTCSLSHEAIRRGEGGIHWENSVPLLANSLLWREIIIALAIPVLVIAAIVLVVSGSPDRLLIIAFFVALFLVFLLIALTVMISISRSLEGGLSARFYANNAGAGFEAGRKAEPLRSGAHVLWLISGLIDAAGPNLKSLTQEENFIAWLDVSNVWIYRRQRVILIRSKERVKPLALYCTPENFKPVEEMIRKKVPLTSIRP
ncbi:MAG: hypothetical protein A4E35_00406 [Methanoregula sp. PtaU1.Bin051]|nr:MAG: hypothetical protein A4E35_00406 [Methanoregula sp. PtaU1.Bin051]